MNIRAVELERPEALTLQRENRVASALANARAHVGYATRKRASFDGARRRHKRTRRPTAP